jgi:hypothetical protein
VSKAIRNKKNKDDCIVLLTHGLQCHIIPKLKDLEKKGYVDARKILARLDEGGLRVRSSDLRCLAVILKTNIVLYRVKHSPNDYLLWSQTNKQLEESHIYELDASKLHAIFNVKSPTTIHIISAQSSDEGPHR